MPRKNQNARPKPKIRKLKLKQPLEEIRQRLGEKVIVKTIRCWKMWPTKPHTIVKAVDCYGNETGEVQLWDGSRTWSESAIVNGNIEVYGEYRLI